MNAHASEHNCRYCRIDLVDIQQLTESLMQLATIENRHPSATVMKCPVCGYSELGKFILEKNPLSSPKIALVGRQVAAG